MKNFVAGNFENHDYYINFKPNFINKTWLIDDMELLKLLSKTERILGNLENFSNYANIDLFVKLNTALDASQYSILDGKPPNIIDIFLNLNEEIIYLKNNYLDAINYINALNKAILLLEKLNFSTNLFKEVHKLLLIGNDNKNYFIGEYRNCQNWIGGNSINNALYIPPGYKEINRLMVDLEMFSRNNLNNLPDLFKIAIFYYQFETIHPFLFANKRLGRLLIHIYFIYTGILKYPILNLSFYFNKNYNLYFDILYKVRNYNNMNEWIKFFLNGVIETATNTINTFNLLLALDKEIELKISNIGVRSKDAQKIVNFLYKNIIIDAKNVSQITEKSFYTAYELLNMLMDNKIVHEIDNSKRNKKYILKDYLNLFK